MARIHLLEAVCIALINSNKRTLIVHLDAVVPVATCLFLEGLAEKANGSPVIGSDRSQDVIHGTFACTSEVEVGRVSVRLLVRLENLDNST